MAKRPRYSRWRRLPIVYRSAEKLINPDPGPQRLTLYIAASLLDAAESQAARLGADNVQQYCAELLARAIDDERVREQVAEVEAKRGTLEGLFEIANDPEYLAELSAQAGAREASPSPPSETDAEIIAIDPPARGTPPIVVTPAPEPRPNAAGTPAPLSAAARTILHHAGQGEDDPLAFLPALRRGQSLQVSEIAELARVLQALEVEYRDVRAIDRRVAFALHRLAYEGQILHTDAWPGAFDEWTVDALRAVQEAVERILSGQDIRYYPTDTGPETMS